MTTSTPTPAPARTALAYWITALIVVFVGVALRVLPSATVKGVGFDELLYRGYVQKMEKGLLAYDLATDLYLEDQRKPGAKAELPPTRFLYIFSGYVWKSLLHGDEKALDLKQHGAFRADPYLASLRGVSTLFSVLAMLLGGVVAWRLAGRVPGLAVLAMMACAPLQIHMSQHAMIDGFFAFWAMLGVWSLWESLRQPQDRRWLALYAVSLFCMVLTKENAFFVFVALCLLLVLGRWTGWGTPSRGLWGVTFIAPAGALLVLITLAGGVTSFVETYRLLVTNAQHLDYAIETGDGPWYRYLVDLMVLSPAVLCLAIAAAFHSWREEKWVPYVLGFVAFTYLIMCNVRYGMNLRYATIWDLPLCLLAFAQLARSARGAGAWSRYVLPALVGLLCLHELNQYRVFFNEAALYELGPADLLNAVKILK
jgi:4-amino-4-deoxy-L-arabinose transferase-like glycosyltransferase